MRTSNIVQNSQSASEVGANAIAMSIDEASSVFLMDALGKLYSRPAQAVLREYLSNAVDAHKAKGGKLPAIQVTLPQQNVWGHKKWIPTPLLVRDFGNGMSEEQFHSILSRYGASTKRDSNAMIGGFGLGAKSGFAVSDEFFMTSYQKGQGLRVRIFKDNLNQGYVEVIDRFSTNEPDGVLVEVPIPEGNLPELSEKALCTNIPFFMGYGVDEIDVRPVGEYTGPSVHDPSSFSVLELGGNTVGWLGKKGQGNSQVYALIGKVAYKVDTAHLASLARSNKLDKELVAALPILTSFGRTKVIDVPIGSVDMPSAREEITYSERSLKTLSAILCKYVLLLKQYLQKRLNAQETKDKVLSFFALLETEGYSNISELTWKGKSLNHDTFRSSSMVFADYTQKGDYGLTNGDATRLTFKRLKELSDKTTYSSGIFHITMDKPAHIPTARRLLTEKTIKSFLNIEGQTFWSNNKALFIITAKDDVINEWLFNSTPLDVSALKDAAERKQREHEAQQKREAELARAKKKQQEAEAELRRKEQEAIAHSTFCHFYLAGNSRSPSYSHVDSYLSDAFSDTSRTKTYYWSEEEIEQFATVTKGLKKISDGREKTSLLFPFIAAGRPNSFNSVVETRNLVTTNYLAQLRLFLRLFFNQDSSMIIIGKARNLEEFKTTYPQIESGVLAVKKEIESQLSNAYSRVMISYNALGIGGSKDHNEMLSLTGFVDALDKSQRDELDPQMLEIAERFKVILSSGNISGMTDRYLLEVLKAFATHDDIKKKSYSMDEDIASMLNKYPLLMKGNFNKYPPEVVTHLLTYIKLCDSQKFL